MILVTFAVPFESAVFRRRPVSRSVRIIHTGVGGDAARVALEKAVCEALPERVISSGFAGALVPGLQIGEIVCNLPDTRWRQARFVTSSEVLTSASEKQAFGRKNGAEVVDMETDAIDEVCRVSNLPLTVLRSISDGVDDDLGLPAELLARLADHPMKALPRLAWLLLTNGARRRAFVRFVQNCRTAQSALADALEREIKTLLAES